MKSIAVMVLAMLMSGIHTSCYADRCNCDDWMGKGGYCVDYVKARIPAFPIPLKDEMEGLKNVDVGEVEEGDVAIFAIKNYWHVAYVEKVHRNQNRDADTIDVSEMNMGDDLSFGEFKARWKTNNPAEWNRALCCGITENYGQITSRKNVPLDTVKQIWSPDDVPSGDAGRRRVKAIVGKVRQVINRFIDFAEGDL